MSVFAEAKSSTRGNSVPFSKANIISTKYKTAKPWVLSRTQLRVREGATGRGESQVLSREDKLNLGKSLESPGNQSSEVQTGSKGRGTHTDAG